MLFAYFIWTLRHDTESWDQQLQVLLACSGKPFRRHLIILYFVGGLLACMSSGACVPYSPPMCLILNPIRDTQQYIQPGRRYARGTCTFNCSLVACCFVRKRPMQLPFPFSTDIMKREQASVYSAFHAKLPLSHDWLDSTQTTQRKEKRTTTTQLFHSQLDINPSNSPHSPHLIIPVSRCGTLYSREATITHSKPTRASLSARPRHAAPAVVLRLRLADDLSLSTQADDGNSQSIVNRTSRQSRMHALLV
ncbi:hypothetical protein J3E69DRAFT_7135 [Trichoderma sp. SZMC 28015]